MKISIPKVLIPKPLLRPFNKKAKEAAQVTTPNNEARATTSSPADKKEQNHKRTTLADLLAKDARPDNPTLGELLRKERLAEQAEQPSNKPSTSQKKQTESASEKSDKKSFKVGQAWPFKKKSNPSPKIKPQESPPEAVTPQGQTGHSPNLREQQIKQAFTQRLSPSSEIASSPTTASDPIAYLRTPMLNAAKKVAHNGTIKADSIHCEDNVMTSIDLGGKNIFSSQADLIRFANKEILFQTFAWEPNSTGANKLMKGLQKLAVDNPRRSPEGKILGKDNQPIKVCMLLNEPKDQAFKKMWPGREKIDLQNPAILLGLHKNDKHTRANEKLLSQFDFEIRTHKHQLINAAHSKTLIVDGQFAGLTGANVQERNHPLKKADDNPIKFYDIGVTVGGPVAQSLREDFVNNWNHSNNLHQVTNDLKLENNEVGSARNNGTEMMVLTKKPKLNPFNQSTANPQDKAILAAVNNARERIQIMTPNFNAPDLEKALLKAMDRGVKVEIIAPIIHNASRLDGFFGGRSNVAAFQHLLENTKKRENCDLRFFTNLQDLPAYEYQNPDDKDDMDNLNPSVNHSKLMIVDDKLAITGSGNMDKTSWYHTGETNIACLDPKIATDIQKKAFDPIWKASQPASVLLI